MPSICPGEGEDSPLLGCFPEGLFCNIALDCPGGIDEVNCSNASMWLVQMRSPIDIIIIHSHRIKYPCSHR